MQGTCKLCGHIFIPCHEQSKTTLDYGPWLKRFIIGLHWKVLVTKEEKYPDHAEAAYAKAEQKWRQFLLGESPSHGNAEFHLFLADVVQDATEVLPHKINWYLARGFDFTPLYSDSGMAGVYAKVVKALTLSYLAGKSSKENWKGTLVKDEGVSGTGQTVEGTLGPFIIGRAKIIERFPKTISPRQHAKLLDRAKKEPETILATESIRTFEADMALKEAMLNRRLHMKDARLRKKYARLMKGRDRNSPCPCGSGVKYKKCHGEG